MYGLKKHSSHLSEFDCSPPCSFSCSDNHVTQNKASQGGDRVELQVEGREECDPTWMHQHSCNKLGSLSPASGR